MPHGFSTVLPADSNPYLNLNGAYKSQLVLKHPRSANTQLFCLSILHGLTIVLLIASLVVNWWKARFWLIRRHAPSPLLVLNFPVVGAIVAIALVTIFEITLAGSIQTFDGWLQKDYGFWLLFSGSTRHLIAETVIWSLAGATIVRSQLKGAPLKFWSYACNVVGIVTVLATAISALVLAILGGVKYSTAVGAYDKLNAFFIEESLTWSPSNLTNRFVPPPGELIGNFATNVDGIERWWRTSFLSSSIQGAIITAGLVVVSVLYLFSLRRNVVKMSQTLDAAGSVRVVEGQQTHLRTTWTLLLVCLATVILLSSMTLGLEFYVYLRPFSFRSRSTSAALLFIPFYLSAIPGFIFAIVLLYNASAARSSSKDAEKGWKTVFVRRWMMQKRKINLSRTSTVTTVGGVAASSADTGLPREKVITERTTVSAEKATSQDSGPVRGPQNEPTEEDQALEIRIEPNSPGLQGQDEVVRMEEEDKGAVEVVVS